DINAVRKGGKQLPAKKSEGGDEGSELFSTQGASFSLQKLFVGKARAELGSVTRLLATLLRAGIPLVDAISSVIQQVEDAYLSTVLRQVREDLQGGVGLADAVAQHPELFDPLYVNMVRAGEASGALDEVLRRVANFMQAQARM